MSVRITAVLYCTVLYLRFVYEPIVVPVPVIATLTFKMSVSVPIQEQQVLDRLWAHGIKAAEYINIRRIVSFDIPHGLLLFAQRFGRRTITQVLAQIDRWKRFLENDTLFTDDEKDKVARLVQAVELVVCQALLDVNLLHIGHWMITGVLLPTGQGAQGQPEYFGPGLRLTAVHRKSKEERSAIISGEELNDLAKRWVAWKRAIEELGLWDLVARGLVHQRVVRAGRPQGWPTFTQLVIPRLYEHLIPRYQKPGHYSEKRDKVVTGKALYPKELLEDMLLIIRFEHPGTFEDATTAQLKAVIQRHVEQKRARSTKPSK